MCGGGVSLPEVQVIKKNNYISELIIRNQNQSFTIRCSNNNSEGGGGVRGKGEHPLLHNQTFEMIGTKSYVNY